MLHFVFKKAIWTGKVTLKDPFPVQIILYIICA